MARPERSGRARRSVPGGVACRPRQPSQPRPPGASSSIVRATNDRARRLEADPADVHLGGDRARLRADRAAERGPGRAPAAGEAVRGRGGFGIWNNWWYGGHNIPGYSVLFPPAAALITPQLAAAIACPASTARCSSRSPAGASGRMPGWRRCGSAWRRRRACSRGRLTFAFGLMPAVGTALALQRRRPGLAVALAFLTALASPVGALFAALAGAAYAVAAYLRERGASEPALPGLGGGGRALGPVLALAVVFPEGGTEPFAFSALWPIVVIVGGGAARDPQARRGAARRRRAVRARLHRRVSRWRARSAAT